MKVLQINAVSGIRSTGRTSVEVADYLNQNGHEGYIAYSDGIPYEKGIKIGTSFEKKLHALYSRVFGKQAYFSKSGTKKLLTYIDGLKPEVVHLRNLHSNYINLGMLLGYLARNDIPTVITLHDCWFFTGKCTHYTLDGCHKWQTECCNCPRLKKDNPSWFFDRTKEMHRDKKAWLTAIPRLAVIGVSDWITNEANESFLSSAKFIIRIYDWLDFDIFKPVPGSEMRRKLGLIDKFVILGVASNWSNAKGLDKFIELAREIPPTMSIVLVGGIKAKGSLPSNLLHIKETHYVDELVEYYSMADVYINLSYEETFGKSTAEALACGTPAIVLNSTANPELVPEGCGLVINSCDSNSILDAVRRIKQEKTYQISSKCIQFSKMTFAHERLINENLNVYRKIQDQW